MRRSSSFLFLGAVLVFAASCGSAKDDGGSSTPTGGTGGGTGAPGGTTGAGTANATAGSPSTAGSPGSAGSSAGGSVGSGGTTNDAGAGGGGAKGMPMPGFGCPGEKPEEGTECKRGPGPACVYDDGGCVCTDGTWSCYSDSDCPATAPADAETCALGGMACNYDELQCTCSTMNGWSCSTPCPGTTPDAGASCRRAANATCRYAGGELVQGFGKADATCSCGENGQFTCFSEADCPATAPENASACEFATLICPYDDRQCTCNGGAWSCVTDCPDTEPADGTACLRPANASCRYAEGALVQGFGGKADSTCICEEEVFTCFGQEDCPATAPATGDACEFASLSCEYTDRQCSCQGATDTWSCVTACPAAVPAQDTACERPEQQVCRYEDGALIEGFGGSAEALCACREQKFDCLTQADCPETAPEAQSACEGLNGLACTYGDQRCTCGMGGWSCQTECPAQTPDAGAACMRPVLSPCLYAGGTLVTGGGDTEPETTCVCSSNAFVCYSDADCPETAPENDVACTTPGLECAYGDQNCRCRTSTNAWSCMAGNPGGPGPGGGGGDGGGGQ